MSTKIYNGYSLPLMGTLELMTFLNKVKTKVVAIHDKLWKERLASQATGLIDLNSLGERKSVVEFMDNKDAVTFYPKWEAYEHIRKKIQKIAVTKERDPTVDFGFNLCLIPTKNKILTILYTEQKEMTKAWESFKEVTSYFYYNNSDQPENITNAEWNKRGKEWDVALGDDGIPGNKALQYHPIPEFFQMPSYEDIKEFIPSLAKRSEMHVNDKAFVEYCENSKDEETKQKVEDKRFVSLIMDFHSYKQTPKGKKLLEKHVKTIKAKLKKRLVKADFINEVKLC
jgi:hypothetical protein